MLGKWESGETEIHGPSMSSANEQEEVLEKVETRAKGALRPGGLEAWRS